MNATMLEEARELAGWKTETDMLSISTVLQQLPDARRKQGKHYLLPLSLASLLVAKVAGETTLQGISEWRRLRGTWLQQGCLE